MHPPPRASQRKGLGARAQAWPEQLRPWPPCSTMSGSVSMALWRRPSSPSPSCSKAAAAHPPAPSRRRPTRRMARTQRRRDTGTCSTPSRGPSARRGRGARGGPPATHSLLLERSAGSWSGASLSVRVGCGRRRIGTLMNPKVLCSFAQSTLPAAARRSSAAPPAAHSQNWPRLAGLREGRFRHVDDVSAQCSCQHQYRHGGTLGVAEIDTDT